MSRIDRMNILGIRSFPYQRGETIIFYTPLTLIVGINGSGKTTVVECLKYATAGMQPPNSKVGAAFVHDPKLTGEKEVMAQVRLQFYSAEGARMVVTRSLQLTVRGATRSLKALEGSLLKDFRGEKTTKSSRVAELDTMVPNHLGVTPAVLDNIIFCHQDESLWPMSEPATLKKKFDEIFEAQKYTKAIDNIKAIRKKQNEELGKYKILEEHAKQDRDRAEKARLKSIALSTEIEALREQCTDLQSKMNDAEERADRLWNQSAEYAKIIGQLQGQTIAADSKRNNIKILRERLEVVEQSDEWLEHALAEFNTTILQYKEEREGKKERWIEWEDEIKTLNDTQSSKLTERGGLERDKKENERQLARRIDMVKESARKHELRGFDDLSNENQVEDFLRKIKQLSKNCDSSLEKDRTASENEKQEVLSLKNKLTERRAALQDNKNIAKQQIVENEREASDYQRRVNLIEVDEGTNAVLESRIEDINLKLQGARDAARASDWESRLKQANIALRSQEEENVILNTELVQATKHADEVAELNHLKRELKEKHRSLETLMNTHQSRITQLVGNDWDAASIDSVHAVVMDEAAKDLNDAEESRDGLDRELEQTQFKQKTLRDELSQKSAQAKHDEKAVTKVIGTDISNYSQIMEQATDNVEKARDQAMSTEGLLDYLRKCMETFESAKPSCRTCLRGFRNVDDQNLANAKSRVKGLIEKAGKRIGEADVTQAEAAYKAVAEAGVPLSSWMKLTTTDIPSLEKAIKELNDQKDSLVIKLEKQDNVVSQARSSHKELEAISRTIASISRHAGDISSYNTQIQELSSRQSQKGKNKTLEDIQDEINALNEQIRNTKKTISTLTSEESASRNQIHEWELQGRDLRNELNASVSKLEKKSSLIARVEEFKASNGKQHEAIEKLDRDIVKLEPDIAAAQAKHEDVVQRWTSRLAESGRAAKQLTDTINKLNEMSDSINAYIERGGDQRLTVAEREIKSIGQNIEQIKQAQLKLTREITKVEEVLRDSENTKRQYKDNLDFRRETRALEYLQEEINDLSARNADVDRDRLQEESRKAKEQSQKFSAKRAGLLGQMKTQDFQLEELLKDFETDFKDAPRRYKEAHIKVETTKAAVSDLQVYGSALDNAIMKFHGIKMEQVNEIIAGLWRKTYKGSDVDTIMIRSDHEAGTTTRGRSYNYRVVMIKQGVEMDMRGRCSAGQKVLASILIRLALADVFSQDCGVIALDEPTTNLDHDNIMSLAQSLHEIIKERQQQSNFQLVVITHDEDFIRAMNCSDFTDYYWRVSRDHNANSIIERQSILEVDR